MITTRTPERVYVIGMGEVGRRLADALGRGGWEVRPVTRQTGWDEAASDPRGVRLLCVREEGVAGTLGRLRNVPADLLVTVQNGWIRHLLPEPAAAVTRGLIWFTSKGNFFSVLRPSPFSGPWAEPLAGALSDAGIAANAVGASELDLLEAEKMGFNCVVGLPLAVHGVTLEQYLDRLADEAHAVFSEAATTCARAVGGEASDSWWGEFLAAVERLGWVSAKRAKALEYRNAAVVRLAREVGLPVPVNSRLLAAHDELARTE